MVSAVGGGYCGVQGLGKGGCGGALGGSSVLSVVVSSLLLFGVSLGGGWPDVLRCTCQDGRGPQSADCSGSGVTG